MNTKFATFVMALVLVGMACNALRPPVSSQTSLIIASTETATPPATPTLPSPSATPEDPAEPRILGVLLEFKYSSDPDDMNKVFGTYPYTHLPANANILAVTFFLDVPVGWPQRKTELHIVWFQDGTPLKDSGSSVVCAAESDCIEIYSRRFSSSGFEDGRYEARLYLGAELLEGPYGEVQLIDEKWVGDLRLMQCDRGSPDTCENAAGQLAKFPERVTVPVGSRAVYVSNAYANLPPGTDWRLELYQGERLIDSRNQATPNTGHSWSGWPISQLSDPSGATLEPGTYTVQLIRNGNVLETVSFEVK
jgi:hypothetical protein